MSFMCETAASQHKMKAEQKDKRRRWDVPEQIAEYSTPSIRGKLSPLTVKSGSCNDVYLWIGGTVLYRRKS